MMGVIGALSICCMLLTAPCSEDEKGGCSANAADGIKLNQRLLWNRHESLAYQIHKSRRFSDHADDVHRGNGDGYVGLLRGDADDCVEYPAEPAPHAYVGGVHRGYACVHAPRMSGDVRARVSRSREAKLPIPSELLRLSIGS